MNRLDNNRIPNSLAAIYAFAKMRNEILRLPYFLEYHRKLGVGNFFIIDNDSKDGTTEYLLGQPDVHLFHTDENFRENQGGIRWLNTLYEKFASGHWTLLIDADELFVYPNCEEIDLEILVTYLDSRSDEAVESFLLDMYSDRQINQVNYQSKTSFLSVCSYFDLDSFKQFQNHIPMRGGVRQRVFWKDYKGDLNPPLLTKIPFVKWKLNLFWKSAHLVSNVRLSTLTSSLLHFKFFSDFHYRAKLESERKQHWNDGREYGIYLNVLEQNSELSLYYENSEKYKSSEQLLELGWMYAPAEYVSFINNKIQN